MEKIQSGCESYPLVEFLGSGSFAEVWHGKCERTDEDVAIKIVDKSKLTTRARIDSEIKVHSGLNHPSVVRLYQTFEDKKYVYLVMELCKGGTLQDYLKSRGGQLTENETRPLFQEIVEGVHYLHSKGIIHRDLSLSNLLLTEHSHVKLSDFGLAKQLNHRDEKHSTMCGTPNFISPEVVTQRPHGLEADMFSLGCILYTMLVGKPPFDTQALGSTLNRVRRVEFSMPQYLSPHSRSLITALLKKDPRERITLQGILCHAFLQKDQVSFKRNQVAFNGLQDSGFGSTATTLSSTGDCSYGKYQQHHGQNDGQLSVIFSERSYVSCQSSAALSSRSNREHQPSLNCIEVPTSSQSRSLSAHGRYSPQNVGSASCSASIHRSVCSHDGTVCTGQCVHMPQCHCQRQVLVPSLQGQPHVRPPSEVNYGQAQGQTSPSEVLKRWSPTCTALANVTPPVTTVRLKPTRQRTKNAIVTITDDGDVVLEFLRTSGRHEKVKSVCRISSDGMKVHIQRPVRGFSPVMGLPAGGEEIVYSYYSLPKEHWSKYEYAARFINLVKAKTPKVTFYSPKAKFILMECTSDFESMFYGGEVITLSSNNIKVVTLTGQTYSMKFEEELFDQEPRLKSFLDHFRDCHQHCVNIESVLSLVESKTEKTCFPVVIGRKPWSNCTALKDSNKENCYPASQYSGSLR